MQNKRTLFFGALLLGLCLTVGCSHYVTPDPLPGEISPAVPEKVPYGSKSAVFSERAVPVRVALCGGAKEIQILKKKIGGAYAVPVSGNDPADITLSVRSEVKTITSGAAYRLAANVVIDSGLFKSWKSSFSSGTPCKSAKQAQIQLDKAFNRGLGGYAEKVLLKEIKKNYRAAELRFHSVKNLQERAKIKKILAGISGVQEVTLIENCEGKRIVSFRVFYNGRSLPGEIKSAFIEKQKEMER